MYIIEIEIGKDNELLYFTDKNYGEIAYNNLKRVLQGKGLKGKLALYSADKSHIVKNCIMATLL